MNKCPRCGSVLVAHETAHAVDGKLWCSRDCAIRDLTGKFLQDASTVKRYNEAHQIACDYYDERAEVVDTETVLAEDLQEVQIAVTCFKTIKLPKCLSEDKAKEVAEKLWNDGIVVAEPGDCDDVRFECELVRKCNSSCDEVTSNE